MNYKCFCISDICKVTYQLKVINQFIGCIFSCLNLKGENSSKSVFKILFCQMMILTRSKTRVIHIFNFWMG